MSTDDFRPSSLNGIRLLAKRIKRRDGCPHHFALDRAAQVAGFSNYKHAHKHFSTVLSLPPRLFLTVYWEDSEARRAGRETFTVDLSRPLEEICPPADLKNARHLMSFRRAASDHLVLDTLYPDQKSARDKICGAVRYLRLMEATGLRPSRKDLWQVPGWGRDPLPRHDHTTSWIDPDTGQYVILDEPYLGPFVEDDRRQWATARNWHLRASAAPSPYFPYECTLFVAAPKVPGFEMDHLMQKLERMPDPALSTNWSGTSVQGHDVFVTLGAVTDQDKKRAKAKGTIYRSATRTTVPLQTRSAIDRRKPNAVMPFSDHRALGSALKRLEAIEDLEWLLTVRIRAVRSEMEDWLFKEHSESDHPDVDFIQVYYGVLEEQDKQGKAGRSSESVRQTLEWCAELLKRHYPDCAPLRRQLKRLSMSSDRVGQSSGDRRKASAAT